LDFAFSDEQEAFRETLRRFLQERAPVQELTRRIESPEGADPALWKALSAELALPGVAIPERHGGQGFGMLELALACEELGRALVFAPFFSTACLAARALQAAGSEAQQAELLPGIASGETRATLALVDPDGGWEPEDLRLEAAPADGGGRVLRGEKVFVTDGADADLVVVAAREPGSAGADGITLCTVRRGDAGVASEAVEPLDPTRPLARLRLDGARAAPLGEPGAAGPGLSRALDEARILLAAECAGGAARCLDSAVAYAKERVQFGRPIGSFQAVKHKCAEVLLEVESARSAADFAAWAATEPDEDLALAASLAKSVCADAYLRAAAENIQIHGGIGFTWECDAHLHYRRARADATLLAPPAWHRTRIAERLL